MEFQLYLEKLVEKLTDKHDLDRCVSCGEFVRLYSKSPYHHPRLCESCIKTIHQKWEYNHA
jgi:recombinational DNA repair protein (RecF pathway)